MSIEALQQQQALAASMSNVTRQASDLDRCKDALISAVNTLKANPLFESTATQDEKDTVSKLEARVAAYNAVGADEVLIEEGGAV